MERPAEERRVHYSGVSAQACLATQTKDCQKEVVVGNMNVKE